MRNELHGFPQEVIDKMLERQVEQGNERDVTVFEQNCCAGGSRGFIWTDTPEKGGFWEQVIEKRNFDLFFERYPKNVYPKVMLVSDFEYDDLKKWNTRVVFMEKLGRYYAWSCATTIEEAKKEPDVTLWKYAKDLPEVVEPVKEYTLEEIAKVLGKPVESIRIKK